MADPFSLGQGENVEGMQEVTLAVLGAAKAGKSTFVQCALDLKKPASSPTSTKRVSLEGVTSILRLVELPISEVGITKHQEIEWPETTSGQNTPQIDGALLLYDVTNRNSIAQIPNMLSEFQILTPLYASIL